MTARLGAWPRQEPIDLWSLGVVFAELASGTALTHGASRGGVAVEYAQLLGQPPARLFASGQYAQELLPLVAHMPCTRPLGEVRQRLAMRFDTAPTHEAQQLVDLIARLLVYDPETRLTARQALCHPFFSPVFPFALLASPLAATAAHEASGSADDGATAAGDAPAIGKGMPTAGGHGTPPAPAWRDEGAEMDQRIADLEAQLAAAKHARQRATADDGPAPSDGVGRVAGQPDGGAGTAQQHKRKWATAGGSQGRLSKKR